MSEEAKKLPTPLLILMAIFAPIMIGFFIMFPSGNFLWTEAWILAIIFGIIMVYMLFWLNKHNPQILRSRTSVKGTTKKDALILASLGANMIIFIILVSLDGGRYHCSMVPLWAEIIGFAGFVLGFTIVFLVMKENAFAAKVVRIDKEAGHKVVTTGPYAVVRHPMYSGFLLMFASMSIALGSLYGLVPMLFMIIILIIRIRFEEQVLHEGLEGYTEYTKKVRKRLIPGIW